MYACARRVWRSGPFRLNDPHEHEPTEPVPDLADALGVLSNPDLLTALDVTLLELEKRLLRYAQKGAEIQEMADEGLVLAARASARLVQAQSAAAHAQSHLQLVGVGAWKPRSTRPSWADDPRVRADEPEPDEV